MACRSCGSEKQSKFGAEMIIHFPGHEGLDKPAVWVFPELVICFACGLTLFRTPEAELRVLENGVAR